MKILILITTYNRPESLLKLLKDINNDPNKKHVDLLIYNDGSDQNYSKVLKYLWDNFHASYSYYDNLENGGKENYWQLINAAYQQVKTKDFDYFIQLPDDVQLIDDFLAQAINYFDIIDDEKKACLNIWNDYSRFKKPCWTPIKTKKVKFYPAVFHKIGWLDMCFISGKRFFEIIDYSVHQVADMYIRDKELSSGVGAQLSKAMINANANIYQVIKSLVIHNDHESVMHRDHRVRNPLITNHEKVTASLATMESRAYSLLDMVNSILPQVDELHVYLNDFEHTPHFLNHPKITYFHSNREAGDLGDAGKFYTSEKIRGYHLTIDDDLIYPPDYVKTIVHAIEHFKRKRIVSFHGRKFIAKPILSYYKSAEKKFSCLRNEPYTCPIDVPGTGVMAYHTDTIKFSVKDFKASNMADIWAAKVAKEKGVEIVMLKHRAGWIKHSTKVKGRDTIYAHMHNQDEFQTEIINSFL